jgi:hypothetical protein
MNTLQNGQDSEQQQESGWLLTRYNDAVDIDSLLTGPLSVAERLPATLPRPWQDTLMNSSSHIRLTFNRLHLLDDFDDDAAITDHITDIDDIDPATAQSPSSPTSVGNEFALATLDTDFSDPDNVLKILSGGLTGHLMDQNMHGAFFDIINSLTKGYLAPDIGNHFTNSTQHADIKEKREHKQRITCLQTLGASTALSTPHL